MNSAEYIHHDDRIVAILVVEHMRTRRQNTVFVNDKRCGKRGLPFGFVLGRPGQPGDQKNTFSRSSVKILR